MKKRAIDKDFDDADVRRLPTPPLAELWSEEARALYGPPADVHGEIAARFEAEGIGVVLDIGCGTGLFKNAYGGRWTGIDRSIEQLRTVTGPRALADALRLPFRDATFGGAVALYVLFFFDDPHAVVAEAARVLEPGGLFATCSPSRDDVPELRHVLPGAVFEDTFAAEDIRDVLGSCLVDVAVTTWDFPAFDLRDRQTVRDYLRSYGYPYVTEDGAERLAQRVDVPLKLTKRGAWGLGRKP